MNTMLNITRTQLPSGTHFHKGKQKCLISPQVGKVKMDANRPSAEKRKHKTNKKKKTKFEEVCTCGIFSTFRVQAWQPEARRFAASFAICISSLMECVSRHVCTSLPWSTIIAMRPLSYEFSWEFGYELNHLYRYSQLCSASLYWSSNRQNETLTSVKYDQKHSQPNTQKRMIPCDALNVWTGTCAYMKIIRESTINSQSSGFESFLSSLSIPTCCIPSLQPPNPPKNIHSKKASAG